MQQLELFQFVEISSEAVDYATSDLRKLCVRRKRQLTRNAREIREFIDASRVIVDGLYASRQLELFVERETK